VALTSAPCESSTAGLRKQIQSNLSSSSLPGPNVEPDPEPAVTLTGRSMTRALGRRGGTQGPIMPHLMCSDGQPELSCNAVHRSQQAAGAANNAPPAAAVVPAPHPVPNLAVPQIAAAPAVAAQQAAPQPAAVQQPARSAVDALRSQWEGGAQAGPAALPMLHRLLRQDMRVPRPDMRVPVRTCQDSMNVRTLHITLVMHCNDR